MTEILPNICRGTGNMDGWMDEWIDGYSNTYTESTINN